MRLPDPLLPGSDILNVIIETPKNCGNKYSYEKKSGLFKLSKVLPQGLVFPAHFGFAPHTKAEDGDPLDIIILMDEISFPGVLIECRPIGVIEAEQTEKNGTKVRNDRIIAVACESQRYSAIKSLKHLDKSILEEITKFFITYNAMTGKKFSPLSFGGRSKAIKLVKKQIIK